PGADDPALRGLLDVEELRVVVGAAHHDPADDGVRPDLARVDVRRAGDPHPATEHGSLRDEGPARDLDLVAVPLPPLGEDHEPTEDRPPERPEKPGHGRQITAGSAGSDSGSGSCCARWRSSTVHQTTAVIDCPTTPPHMAPSASASAA